MGHQLQFAEEDVAFCHLTDWSVVLGRNTLAPSHVNVFDFCQRLLSRPNLRCTASGSWNWRCVPSSTIGGCRRRSNGRNASIKDKSNLNLRSIHWAVRSNELIVTRYKSSWSTPLLELVTQFSGNVTFRRIPPCTTLIKTRLVNPIPQHQNQRANQMQLTSTGGRCFASRNVSVSKRLCC